MTIDRGSEVLKALSREPFAVIGHRGAKALATENTAPSIEKAVEAGADLVEVDLQKSKDNVIFLSHDQDTTVDGERINLRELTYEEISSIKTNRYLYPKLEDILIDYADKIPFLLEIKNPDDADDVAILIKNLNLEDKVAFISFHLDAVKKVRKISARSVTGLIYFKPPGLIVECKEIRCNIVLPRYPLATHKAVKFAHRLGLKVIAWTVNSIDLIKRVAENDVDGITTDRPDIAVRIRDEMARGI